MTVEHRLLFGLSDIVALTLECSNCGIRLTVAPGKVQTEQLRQCPSCGALWLANDTDVGGPFRGGPFNLLLLALKHVSQAPNPNDRKVGFTLHFEFAAPAK